MSEDALAKWMRQMMESHLKAMQRFAHNNIITFTFYPPPLGSNGTAQALNPCPTDCPMYRHGKGCMASRCVKTREQNTVEPAKIGEQPKDE